jgi:hypothetical protein
MDLNLDHYSFQELLKVFHLDDNFTEKDLKLARKKVVAAHPDKSNLDKSYFLFFHNAYMLLYQVYQFKHRTSASMSENMSFQDIMDGMRETDKEVAAKAFTSKTSFNKEFNELFDKFYIQDNDGYGDWLKSSDDLDVSFERRKQDSRAITINRIESANTPTYSDLKRVYTVDSVIGVSESDFKPSKSFETIKQERSMHIQPLRQEQSQRILQEGADEEDRIASARAFKLMQQVNVNQKHQVDFWGQLLKLK